jgi:hypothetical protein
LGRLLGKNQNRIGFLRQLPLPKQR